MKYVCSKNPARAVRCITKGKDTLSSERGEQKTVFAGKVPAHLRPPEAS